MIIHSSFSDFVLFLYVHFAHIDDSYDPKELLTIKSKMGKLFPEGTDLERKLYQTIREYNRFDRTKFDELCKESLLHFRNDGEASTLRLLDDIQEIIKADGQIDRSESEMLSSLKAMIEKHTETF